MAVVPTIPWIPILSAGAGLLGSLFGDQKNLNQNENSTSTGTSASLGKTELDSTTTQHQTQTQNSNQQSSQASTEDVNMLSSQKQTADLTRLDSGTLDMLTQAVQSGLGGGQTDLLRKRLAEISGAPGTGFDGEAYVNDIMAGARSDMAGQVESATGGVRGKIGATGKSNSAAALLEAKIKNQSGAALAGVHGEALAKAEQLRQAAEADKTSQVTNLAAATEGGTANLLSALLQARESQTQNTVGNQNQQTTGNTAGTTTGQTSMVSDAVENTDQSQTQAQTATQASKTSTNTKQNTSELNWGDMFTNIGKALSSGFN